MFDHPPTIHADLAGSMTAKPISLFPLAMGPKARLLGVAPRTPSVSDVGRPRYVSQCLRPASRKLLYFLWQRMRPPWAHPSEAWGADCPLSCAPPCYPCVRFSNSRTSNRRSKQMPEGGRRTYGRPADTLRLRPRRPKGEYKAQHRHLYVS